MDAYFACHKELNLLNPEAHRIFRALVEEIKIGIFMADSQGRIFYSNAAFKTLVGHPEPNALMGQNWTYLLFPQLHDRTRFLSTLNEKGLIKDFEIHLPHTASPASSLLITVNFIHNDQEQRIGVHGFIVDISERLLLEQELVQKHQKLEQILDFYNALGSMLQLEGLSEFIVQKASSILNAKRCSLMLLDPAKNELYIKAAMGIEEDIVKTARVKVGESIAGLIAMQNRPMLVENIEDFEPCRRKNGQHYTHPFFMSAPLISNHQIMGVINISEGDKPFNKIDLKVLEAIAQHSAMNMHKAQTLHNLEHLSQTDPLTGLWNYRSFIAKLDEEIARISRYNAPLSLMIIDIDHFKRYNDSRGHLKGDELLSHIAGLFRKYLRSTEFICRHGGDEFSVILPQTDIAQAAVAAEKLRTLTAEEYAESGITLSIGISQHQKSITRDFFINMADQALYQSKKSGRNRVSVSRTPLAML